MKIEKKNMFASFQDNAPSTRIEDGRTKTISCNQIPLEKGNCLSNKFSIFRYFSFSIINIVVVVVDVSCHFSPIIMTNCLKLGKLWKCGKYLSHFRMYVHIMMEMRSVLI